MRIQDCPQKPPNWWAPRARDPVKEPVDGVHTGQSRGVSQIGRGRWKIPTQGYHLPFEIILFIHGGLKREKFAQWGIGFFNAFQKKISGEERHH